MIIFHSSFFHFSPLFFYPPHTAFLSSFFSFFSPTHTYTFSFLFYPSFLLFFPCHSSKLQNIQSSPSSSLFFFFFLALRLLVLGGIVDTRLWEKGPLLGKGAFGSVFLAKPTSKFCSFPSLMAVKSADQCFLVFCWSNLYLQKCISQIRLDRNKTIKKKNKINAWWRRRKKEEE